MASNVVGVQDWREGGLEPDAFEQFASTPFEFGWVYGADGSARYVRRDLAKSSAPRGHGRARSGGGAKAGSSGSLLSMSLPCSRCGSAHAVSNPCGM